LTTRARDYYSGFATVPHSILLTKQEWLPDNPVNVDDVRLEVVADPPPNATWARLAMNNLPLANDKRRFQTYGAALEELTPNLLLDNRLSYRIDSVRLNADPMIAVGRCTYFDTINVAEALAHEWADASTEFETDSAGASRWVRRGATPLRNAVGDPLSLLGRRSCAAIDILTLRRDGDEMSFVLHSRDPNKVASAGNLLHVAPTGIFQPAARAPDAFRRDRDLWLNSVREYAEEFLGVPEASGSAGERLDYDHTEPFASINAAKTSQAATMYLVGAGIDPLTLWVELLAVCVFDGPEFDRVFPALVKRFDEGTLIPGNAFVDETVREVLADERLSPAAAACISLAWERRDFFRTARD
jgi:hypothetical protein